MPRVYGLGDLSTILDERKASQTRYLLGHLEDTLRVYVPTNPHRNAVRCLSKHKIVLLLGEPATGKSTIAAILATSHLGSDGKEAIKCDGPLEFSKHWNPNEKHRLYWIDDAFGANQVRLDFVDAWISLMPSVQAATQHGNRFIFTSRRHIYEEAKPKLGTRNHPLFRNTEAVVDVGILTQSEKEQILYNHIKAGNQSKIWKKQVKTFLNSVTRREMFLPEIARRLGNSSFTVNLEIDQKGLNSFFDDPKDHLVEIIEEIGDVQKAALALVYTNRSRLLINIDMNDASKQIAQVYGVPAAKISDALEQLDKSFIVKVSDDKETWWSFKHPTFVDAISDITVKSTKLSEMYLKGARWENIVSEVICAGMPNIKDALVVNEIQTGMLVERLLEIPDEPQSNKKFFNFLSSRASDKCIASLIDIRPNIFERKPSISWLAWNDPKLALMARVNIMGLLPEEHRLIAQNSIETYMFQILEFSILEEESLLKLFNAVDLLKIPMRIRALVQDIAEKVDEIESDFDPRNEDPEGSFDDYRAALHRLIEFFADDYETRTLLTDAEEAMKLAIARMTELVNQDVDDDEWDSDDVEPDAPSAVTSGRSIFSDVDE